MLTAAAIAAAPAAASAQKEAAPLSVSARASAKVVEGSDLGGNYLLTIGGVLVAALVIFLLVGDFDNDAEPQPASP